MSIRNLFVTVHTVSVVYSDLYFDAVDFPLCLLSNWLFISLFLNY